MFDGSTIPVLEQVVQFTQMRHGVLAGNIANLDTPGYRTRDISPEQFEKKLAAAISSRDSAASVVSPGQDISIDQAKLNEVGENLESILYHDESNVGLEQQVAQIAKNQAQHNLAIALMRQQFSLLEAAISERVV
ncbi:MAG: flagellar basal body rod protein FlgB [Planctomycetales bacterium]|nr:flagellar basal body rod protein FlgB [Planctomycetales bacterium]